jgi:hypothetical protein
MQTEHVGLGNERPLRALRSLDEGNISKTYLHGELYKPKEAA